MARESDDLVRVAAGSLTRVHLRHDALRAAGIESRAVGGDLAAGLGIALPGSVERWARRGDAAAAGAAIAGAGGHRRLAGRAVSRRLLGAAVALVLLPAFALAQVPAAPPPTLPVRPVMNTPLPGNTAGYVGAVAGGGAATPYLDLATGLSSYPAAYYASPWPGGFITPRGLYVPYGVVLDQLGAAPPPAPTPPPAVLTVRFPAAASVRVGNLPPAAGSGSAGGSEWVFTAPVPDPGGRFTFRLRAEWSAGGRTFDYERTVTVASGDRGRLTVLAGTPRDGAE